MKVAVVGAGLTGLTAALKLSQLGARVTLYEKDKHAGGRAKTMHREGFSLNLGAHALYVGGEAHRFLTENRITPAGGAPQSAAPVAIYKGNADALPITAGRLVANKYLSVVEKIEFSLLLYRISKLDLSPLYSQSLSEWVARTVKSEKVQQTFKALVRLTSYSDNPEQMSAGVALAQLLLAQKGVLYLDNGWGSIVESLLDALPPSVHRQFGAAVTAVSDANGAVKLVFNDRHSNFDAVIFCLPPEEIRKLLPAADARLARLKPNRIACLDLCLKTLPAPNRTFALGIDEPLYFSVHSLAAKLAPEGAALIHTGYYFSGDNDSDHEKRLEVMLDQLQPGWREVVIYKRYLPNMVASYGMPYASLNGANGLADTRVSERIFVCGDYVGSGALLADAGVRSALQAIDLLHQLNVSPRVESNV